MLALTSTHIVEPPLFLPLAARCFGMMATEVPHETASAFQHRMANACTTPAPASNATFPSSAPATA